MPAAGIHDVPSASMAQAVRPSGRRRLTRAARAEQLLDVAEAQFVALGVDGASIEGIAAAAGVSRPVVYDHFGSKEDLFLRLLVRARSQFDADLAAGVAGIDDPVDRLRAGITAAFRFMAADRRRWALLFDRLAASGPLAAEQQRLREATVGAIAEQVRLAFPTLDRDRALAHAQVLSGAAEQLERWWRTRPDLTVDDLVEHLFHATWDGFRSLTDRP